MRYLTTRGDYRETVATPATLRHCDFSFGTYLVLSSYTDSSCSSNKMRFGLRSSSKTSGSGRWSRKYVLESFCVEVMARKLIVGMMTWVSGFEKAYQEERTERDGGGFDPHVP